MTDPSETHPGEGFEVTDNTGDRRFELRRDGILVGYASYLRHDGVVTVPHVETFAAHRGQGYAARLMDGLLAQLRAEDERIVPLCPFAADHIASDPAHHDLVAR